MSLKKIYTAANAQEASMIEAELASAGIICKIYGLDLAVLRARLPNDTFPTIMVEEDQAEHALKVLHALKESYDAKFPPWVCACGEENEGQFSACWNCGRDAE